MIVSLTQTPERPLTPIERNRLHTALVEAEFEIERFDGWIPEDYARIIGAPVMCHPVAAGCYSLNVLPRTDARLRLARWGVDAGDDEAVSRWWHRFTDWWWKW